MSKIVIDARESGTSTGRYIDKLIEHLAQLDPAHEVVILTRKERLGYIDHIAPSFKTIEAPFPDFSFAEQLGFNTFLHNLRPDLVHFGMVQQPVLYHGNTVTTIHDLTTARFNNPDKNPLVFFAKQQVYKYVIKKAARKSAHIITPTTFVKEDLVKYTHIAGDKVSVTYEAADAINDDPVPFRDLEGTPFLLYVGRPTPHKNLERLMDAFQRIHSAQPTLRLVLAGKKDANYRRIEAGVDPAIAPYITFTDFVREGQLRWLYEHCAAYIFPSLSEGFGLPGLEAMIHGAPVVSSNTTCLPEVYGKAAHYFDPLDVDAMSRAITDVLNNAALRETLIQAGYKQASTYSWQRMAKQTLAIYEQVLAQVA